MPKWEEIALLLLLALVLRFGWAAAHHTDDLRHFQSGDYGLYRIGAAALAEDRDFSNPLFLVRPPLFPAMIAALGRDDTAVLVVNGILGALIVPLTWGLARQLGTGRGLARLAALIVAFDPPSIVYSTYLLAEPLANLLLLLGVMALLTARTRSGWGWAAAAGTALALSAWARPAGFLLFVPLAVWLAWGDRARWRVAAVVAAIPLLATVAWTVHNARQFDNTTYSTIGIYNLLYYRAASVEHQATGDAMNTVYARLAARVEERAGRDPARADADTRHHHYSTDGTTQRAMIAEALDVFAAHPLYYVALVPVGLVRFALLTNPLPEALEAVAVGWNALLTAGALIGLWIAWRERRDALFWLTLILGAYFTVGTLAVQTSGLDTRMRSMLTPLLAVACALALARLVAWWRDRRAGDALSPPA